MRQSFVIEEGICYTTKSIRHVVVLKRMIYDTTRLCTSFVLQESTQPFPATHLLNNRVKLGSHDHAYNKFMAVTNENNFTLLVPICKFYYINLHDYNDITHRVLLSCRVRYNLVRLYKNLAIVYFSALQINCFLILQLK
jgi:hypothetical protein